ncbi:MAG: hypothetical protein AVDCRST_MAG74-831 [uncultured Pyrinomonadaceae bacterium]|uniref:Uncharacterized protein n=1 Tax=uncultured Pyrinomonadaceae bacterium TaxID=2283094 RepID=A0A6J4NFL0_9BACT|nr:MAG: hypothetical protein AVDCRST_MAG74-831 [uncultured Pyrinomonadaceae bacterium]
MAAVGNRQFYLVDRAPGIYPTDSFFVCKWFYKTFYILNKFFAFS